MSIGSSPVNFLSLNSNSKFVTSYEDGKYRLVNNHDTLDEDGNHYKNSSFGRISFGTGQYYKDPDLWYLCSLETKGQYEKFWSVVDRNRRHICFPTILNCRDVLIWWRGNEQSVLND